jgi:hypothetical protein
MLSTSSVMSCDSCAALVAMMSRLSISLAKYSHQGESVRGGRVFEPTSKG